jgi:hypothetical protein
MPIAPQTFPDALMRALKAARSVAEVDGAVMARKALIDAGMAPQIGSLESEAVAWRRAELTKQGKQ